LIIKGLAHFHLPGLAKLVIGTRAFQIPHVVAMARGARIVRDRTVPKEEAMANNDMVFANIFLLSESKAHFFRPYLQYSQASNSLRKFYLTCKARKSRDD
jgi:hypothetical protein